MRRATRSIDAFIGPSLFTMRMHRERGIQGPMIQLPLFHPDQEVSTSTPVSTNDGKPFFFFVGRLEKIKGVQTLIPVFRNLPDVDLVIAGGGEFEGELRRMADGAANVKFVGRCDHATLQAFYREAIATIVPSLCYETFGVVAAESFSASTPVIIYKQSSLEEIVSTHGGGLMYRTSAELINAIDRLLNDQELRNKLGREGRVAYETEFAEDSFLRHYLEVVGELLAKKQAGEPMASIIDEAAKSFAGRPVL